MPSVTRGERRRLLLLHRRGAKATFSGLDRGLAPSVPSLNVRTWILLFRIAFVRSIICKKGGVVKTLPRKNYSPPPDKMQIPCSRGIDYFSTPVKRKYSAR